MKNYSPLHPNTAWKLISEAREDKIIVHHDPFVSGVDFEDWIQHYNHSTLILNVKEEGLEPTLIKIMNSRSIDDYFFLDQSFPSLVKWANMGERRCALRVSEYEPIETALHFSKKLDWVWVDCFNHFPIHNVEFLKLKEAAFKIYLVSPELQGREPETQIALMADMLRQRNIDADAICTKRPDLWEQELSLS